MKFSNYTLKYILIIFFCLTISNCYSQVCPADGGDQRFGGNDAGFGFFIFGIGSWDPNQIITPKGYDSARWVSINDRMGISIFFENDPNLATAPVHNAYVYYKFPPKQDPASFRLGGYGFNGMLFTVPPNLNFYQTRLDLRDSLDLYVDVTAGINVVTNTAFWIFQSIDPLTNQPPLDPLKGFLPIKDTSITAAGDALSVKGEGFVNFTAKPMATAQTRDTIFAQAQIVFDVNDTISTNIEFNTIDARPPTSHMTMGTVVQDTIHLFWTGQDDNMGSGIQDYALFYSENNGPYILYKDKLTGLQTTFVGVTGKTYCFNIRARDNTGNTESLKDSCELSVTVNLSTTVTCPDNLSVCISAASFALSGGLPVGGTYSGNGVGAGSFNPATSGFGVHTITYTYTDPTTNLSSNCTFSISVNSPTVINCPENISVCVNAASFPLAGGMPLGGTYSGTGVSGANFNPSIAGTGVHTITYTYNDPSTNCVGFCSFTITVRPLPVVTCPGNLSVLSTLSPFALAGGTPAGGTFSGPGVNSGMFNPATAGEGVKTITYSYTDPSTNCSSSCTFTITVTTPGTVTCPGNASVCINVAPFALSALGGSPVGGTFSGTGVSDGNFNPSAAGIGVHTISYTYIDPSTNISSNCTFTITVHQQPAVTCPGHSSVCINEGLIELTGGLPGGGAYSGLGVSNGNFDPEAAGAGTHTLTYSFTHQTTGCSNSCTFTITVNALPLVTCPVNSAVCINAASFALSTLGGSPTGGTYSGTGVSGGNFNPAAAGAGTHTLTYSYSHPITGCANSCTFTITVNALPLVTCPVNSAVCINAASFALSTLGGSPTGGTYSGTGVSGGSFNPAVAGSGVKTITYTYTNPSTGCSNSCTFTITVNALPLVTCPVNSAVCINAASFALSTLGGSPTGGTYSGTGVGGGSFNPAVAGSGVKTITYTYTNPSTGCSNSCTFTITVNALPVVNAGTYPTQSVSGSIIPLSGTPAGGSFSGPGVISNSFNPGMAGGGIHTITYSYTNATTGCSNSATTTISVSAIICPATISIIAGSPNDFCSNLTLTAVPSIPGSYSYQWKRGTTVAGTQQALSLSLADPDAVYTVMIPGCPTSPANYNYQKQNLIQSYNILATEEVDLGELNNVLKGSVGATQANGMIKVDKKSSIASPGAFAKARNFDIHSTANVPIQITTPAMVTLPTMQPNTTTPSGSNLTITANGTYAGNYKDVMVKKNVVATLTGSIFKKVTVEEGAKLTFNSSVVNAEELDIRKGKSNAYTRMNFAGNTSVRVEKKVDIGDWCRINEGGFKVTFYVEDEDFIVDGKATRVVANVYAPNGEIEVSGNNTYTTFMTGRYIAIKVKSKNKNVTWNAYDCQNGNSIPVTRIPGTVSVAEPTNSQLEVEVFPNPSSTSFNLTAVTSSKEMLNITMYNLLGLKVQQIKAMPGQMISLGGKIVSGTYLIEVKQGNERVTVKVVKH